MSSLYTHQSENVRKTWLFVAGLLVSVAFPVSVFAHDVSPKNYVYNTIDVTMAVNQDSTVDVTEEQTYDFSGHFHKGWRSIPLKGVSSITDVRVFDEQGNALEQSLRALNKDDMSSWGKYFSEIKNGVLNIEWYYDSTDEMKTWTLAYTLHGSISFLKDKDELYWNLFTDYDVPVGYVHAVVTLPEDVSDVLQLQSTLYSSRTTAIHSLKSATIPDTHTFDFKLAVANPKEAVTIAAGWPKGIVSKSAFWRDFLEVHLFGFLSVLLVLLTVVIVAVHWYISEVRGKGRGTIIPEYTPPRNLPPAMAEVLVKEKTTRKTWPATVIDLAVRGYIDIAEEKAGIGSHVMRYFAMLVPVVFFVFLIAIVGDIQEYTLVLVLIAIVIVCLRIAGAGQQMGKGFFTPKEYVLTAKNNYYDDKALKVYERDFLHTLLGAEGRFSTADIKKSTIRQKKLYNAMKSLERMMYKEVEEVTGAYEVGVSKEIIKKVILWVAVFLAFFLFAYGDGVTHTEGFIFLLTAIVCGIALYSFVNFEARLNKEGAIFREEWLGFRLYLKTAERDRLQNLTPELFEKYLPYAIIFGIEKKWARAFSTLNVSAPTWYHGAYIAHGGRGGVVGFNPSTFSASFVSSFGSSFSSTGGGGASGGGGGAGGGGGGGGGGAS